MPRRLLAALLLAVLAPSSRAEVKPHGLFSDHMVLQRDVEWNAWGTAAPNEKVAVILHDERLNKGETVEVSADQEGKFAAKMPARKAGGPFTLTFQGTNTVRCKDVYFGEVWVCSGQSNMEWSVNASAEPDKVKAGAEQPMIRLYTVPRTQANQPAEDVRSRWQECTPRTVGNFSAVAYHFGRDLQKALDVPIGLIHTSWGGTPAQAWTPRETLQGDPALASYAAGGAKLYNGMVAPLLPYKIKGAIWYQGESNAGEAYRYRTLFPAMIHAWRAKFGQGDFPFLFVQLAPFMAIVDKPQESQWAELREAQLLTTKKVKNTAMAVITDAGDPRDIHPKAKEVVGKRLALAARALTYAEKVAHSGPDFQKMTTEDNKAVLSFEQLGGGLEAKDGELKGFTICGEDKKFHNAKAEIKGETVVVWSDEVAKPVAVRYGWANCPVCNLYNKAGLPASPFRTDDFPILTGPKSK